ncbi:MAG: secreted protein [Microbacteriaceae bacterium]|jgi:hypothetical protein|nr:secreted protein [Microbacteriaceae bacterium]
MSYRSHRAGIQPARGAVYGRHTRSRYSLPLFAFTAALALVLVLIFTPNQVQVAVAASVPVGHAQTLNVNGSYTADAARDSYGVTKRVVDVSAPAASVPAGEAQLIAYNMLISMGMGDDQFSCLVSLWNKESHWSTTAGNASGAYGIPQALPGSKMASAGPDWQTNATTQITWGLGYIDGRYGSPCAAWAHSEASNWY